MTEGLALIDSMHESQEDIPLPAEHVFARGHDGSVFKLDGFIGDSTFDDLLQWAAEKKASDITIQTGEFVKADIGGDIVDISSRPIQAPEVERMVVYVYAAHGPGMIKAARDLDPSHEVRMKGIGRMRYRINATGIRVPGGSGIQITIRTLPATPIDIDKLGVEPAILRNVRPRDGMVLITGPTGSGKSTLLASIIAQRIALPNANEKVVEFAEPIEYVYDDVPHPSASIAQTEIGKHLMPPPQGDEKPSVDAVYAYAVRNALRRKPTIITIAETRDTATMDATMEAALTGHLVYSTMHTVGVPATINRILQFYPGHLRDSAAASFMEAIRMVVTQSLVDRVGGGKVGLREYMIFDAAARAQFLKQPPATWPAMARRMIREKRVEGRLMTESAWLAYDKGLISDEKYKEIVINERSQR